MCELKQIVDNKISKFAPIILAKIIEEATTNFWAKYSYLTLHSHPIQEPQNLEYLWYGYYNIPDRMHFIDSPFTIYKDGRDFQFDLDYLYIYRKSTEKAYKEFLQILKEPMVLEIAIEHEDLLLQGNLQLL